MNIVAREVAAKIVFYGPGLSGKTTTLRRIHRSVRSENRGEMISLATEGDHTLFFDFLPVNLERVGDFRVRLALYTVPGQVFYNGTRKLVLQGADGVVFVADSRPETAELNRQSLINLEANLLEQGVRLDSFPLVFQWNKRDLPMALPITEMRSLLNPRGIPEFETCATSGLGVLATLKAITRLIIQDLRTKRVVSTTRPGARPIAGFPEATSAGAGLEHQIQDHLDSESLVSHGGEQTHRATTVSTTSIGAASTLASAELMDYARAADSAFASDDAAGCVQACHQGVRRALAYTGPESLASRGYLLRIDGGDLFKLQRLATGAGSLQRQDAAFALYVLMQVLIRLADAPISTPAAPSDPAC